MKWLGTYKNIWQTNETKMQYGYIIIIIIIIWIINTEAIGNSAYIVLIKLHRKFANCDERRTTASFRLFGVECWIVRYVMARIDVNDDDRWRPRETRPIMIASPGRPCHETRWDYTRPKRSKKRLETFETKTIPVARRQHNETIDRSRPRAKKASRLSRTVSRPRCSRVESLETIYNETEYYIHIPGHGNLLNSLLLATIIFIVI
jgi:hypothetical protein